MGQFFPGFGPSRMPGEGPNMPVVFWDDFITGYSPVDDALTLESDPTGTFSPVADKGEWLYTFAAGGTDPLVQDDADGGTILFKTDGDSGDVSQIQLNGEAFTFAKDRKLIWQSRLKMLNTTADAVFGLSLSGTDAHGTPSAVGVFAFQLTGDADLEYYADTTGGAAPVTTDTGYNITADTFVTLAFEWDGIDTVRMYADAAEIARTTVNMPLGRALSPVFCVESNGAEETITIDYVYVAMDRA